MADKRSDQAYQERLKSALWYHVGKLIDEECLSLNTNATPQFIGSLTEMVWSQLENVARDLESFSKHANRSTITTQDVLLLTRKNDQLHELIKTFVEEQTEAREAEAKRKAGRKK